VPPVTLISFVVDTFIMDITDVCTPFRAVMRTGFITSLKPSFGSRIFVAVCGTNFQVEAANSELSFFLEVQ
jgi:hypothetical protein